MLIGFICLDEINNRKVRKMENKNPTIFIAKNRIILMPIFMFEFIKVIKYEVEFSNPELLVSILQFTSEHPLSLYQ